MVSVGFIEGGQAGNVIPETVRFGGTLRSMTSEGLSYLMQRIKEVFKFAVQSPREKKFTFIKKIKHVGLNPIIVWATKLWLKI